MCNISLTNDTGTFTVQVASLITAKTLLFLMICTAHPWGNADGGTVVKVLCYKSEGRWFDSRWCHWNYSIDIILPIALWSCG
jgi:hypothetical protein